ncbi:hypothetical protein H8R18_05745 [Nanchangia anserum]|uniref:Uncharacterized protein n=1 Tax=Nanchangia anserum TaxID=2692125 RepID=A0A8I0G733_9ACTO|nr:hypothetical protein [Nanchangia anserum]MBD3689040.1 hypothetical protein [Nanchangia anserum]QOX81284.1 hypothetical protein H8R18_05745 [Nanchangia anserum]
MWKAKSQVPESVRPHVAPGEKVLALATVRDGGYLLASRTHLTHVDDGGVLMREAWCVFSALTWDEDSGLATLSHIDPAAPPLVIALEPAPSLDFLTVVREGMDRARVFYATSELSNGTQVSCWVLRDSRGELFTLTTASGAIPPMERGEVDRLEARTRESVGLDPA